jgi:hypothetical protein
MAISQQQQNAGQQQFGNAGASALSGAALFQDSSSHQDSVSSYFECITACSIDDGECVTRCVEVLREQP